MKKIFVMIKCNWFISNVRKGAQNQMLTEFWTMIETGSTKDQAFWNYVLFLTTSSILTAAFVSLLVYVLACLLFLRSYWLLLFFFAVFNIVFAGYKTRTSHLFKHLVLLSVYKPLHHCSVTYDDLKWKFNQSRMIVLGRVILIVCGC